MASLTIRKLDDNLKQRLRCAPPATAARWRRKCAPSCRRGRRCRQPTAPAVPDQPAPPQRIRPLPAAHREIARRIAQTPRPAHHRRRHRRLQIARPDPAAARARRARALHDDGGGAGVHHAAVGRRARRRARLHRSVRRRQRVRRRPYPPRARHRPDRGRAGDRRPDGEDGERPGRRSRLRGAARDRQADPARAGDEPAHVGATRRRGAISPSSPPTASTGRSQCRRDGGARRGRRRPHGGAARDRRRRQALLARRPRGTSPANACWSPRARRTSRSIRCATSPTARPASRAMPSPPQRRRPARR